MSKRRDTDKAIRNIMRWADRPEWSAEMSAVYDAHLDPICERIGISQEELGRELAEHGYGGMLFGIMFEDFLSRRLPPDDKNVIDDYLKRRGWRESVPGRRYLQQLRDSVLSLYEIVEVSPGRHCDIRDLLRDRDGETVRVHERMGTQNLVKWDRIAARVLESNGRHIFSGGILPFPLDSAQKLLKMLDGVKRQLDENLSAVADKESRDKLSTAITRDLMLRESCPAFTLVWLMSVLERLRNPLPKMTNRDGESLVFTETRFPVLAGQGENIIERLDAAPDWERDQPGEDSWVWLSEQAVIDDKPSQGMVIESFQDGARHINGSLELEVGVLTLVTNSEERSQRGQELLETLLHGLVGPALSKLETPEQMMAERETHRQDDDDREPEETIDPELAAEVIHRYLDQHYRQCLDEPIPMLDNQSPRQCAASDKGRGKVIEWLKHLENIELHRAANQGQAPYDCGWIWEELKLEKWRD